MKQKLRIEIRNKFKDLSKNQKELMDCHVNRNLINFIQTLTCNKIGLYIPIYHEVNIETFFNFLVKNKYQISLPIWNHKNENVNDMEFIAIKSIPFQDALSKLQGNKLFPSYLQPRFDADLITMPEVIIIPCIGYNKEKFRLGYGGGYYDIYLTKNKNIIKISIAYELQKIDLNFQEDYDIKMDFIINEKACF